jgi:hypothetical protein
MQWGPGHPAQEAQMRRALSIVTAAALTSVVLLIIITPSRTIADRETIKRGFQNQISIYGLHIALPDDMKSFPMEIVPLP